LRNTKSKHFVKSKLSENSSLNHSSSDFERDDDDPLSIRSLFTTFLGIIIVLFAILLPSVGVLLGRPFSQGDEVIFNHSHKKDGS
tara:strand:- start:29 stop:283 length:255 start_codon:yes stop_codon:yes gene_type:complete